MNDYISKLKKYCNYDFDYEILGNYLRIRVDNETSYEYDMERCDISIYERGEKRNIGRWSDKKISDYVFASRMKNTFGGGIDYGDSTLFEEASTLQELNELLKERFDTSLFSVGSIEEKKLSLMDNEGSYKIVYSYNDDIKVIEESDDREFVFGRFYNEIVYQEYFNKKLSEYTSVFEIGFTEDEIRCILHR